MGEKAKGLWGKAKGALGKVGKTVWVIIAAAVVVVGAAIGFAVWQNGQSNPYEVLFTGLTSDDMQSVTAYLANAGVEDYQIQGTDTVKVRKEQEPSLKAALLMEGYPKSGFGYETYLNNVGSLATESDRRTMYLYDLQDRLGAVIRCLEGVRDAQVTIAAGEDRRYVLGQDDVVEASAGVIVTMQDGEELSSKQANAIRSLVGSSVQGLSFEQIKISDTQGNTYDAEDPENGGSTAAEVQYALEEQVNNKVRKNVLAVLTPMYGEGNVSVGVNTTVEMSNAYEDSTTYTLPDWASDGSTNGEGIVGKKIWSGEIVRGDDAAGGTVGTTTNADINTYVQEYTPDGNEDALSVNGEKDYLVDTTHTQTERMAGTVTDVMVSVSINSDVPNTASPDALVGHVARAAGITADVQAEKISILTHPFYKPEGSGDNEPANVGPTPILGIVPDWVLYALIAGLLLFMMLFFLLLSMRRKKEAKAQLEEAPVMAIMPDVLADMMAPQAAPEEGPEGADIMEVHMERSMELRRSVREFAEQNPEIAAQMVKNWLKGDEDGHAEA